LKSWTILLAILAFGFSMIGTFVVRSGVLTSVHAFANDPVRGMYILGIITFFLGGGLMYYAARANTMQAKGAFSVVSRESALVVNNVLLTVATFVVFVGTIWPLISELFFNRSLSVGPPFFDAAFTPFILALALVLPLGAILPWKRARLGRALYSLRGVLGVSVAVALLVWSMQSGRSALAPIGFFLGSWLILGAGADLWQRTGRKGWANRLGRLLRLPRADWGKAMAHSGLGVTILGISALTAWEVVDIRIADVGDSWPLGDRYEVTLVDIQQLQGPNYFSTRAEMTITKGGREIATVFPEKRVYPVAGSPTTEAGIANGVFRDLFLVIGDPQESGGFAVRSHIKPLVNWIWAGYIIMALGGVMSLTDRRYRVAAVARKAMAKTVAAE
ncbi:MAG: heme lyase CcmF/NrfE family subunit, partial [Halocynthiibacter sp.]